MTAAARTRPTPPARRQRERGDVVRQTLEAVRYLATEPRQAAQLAQHLGISNRTAWRILDAIEASGLVVRVTHEGREAYHQVDLESLKRYLIPGARWPAPPA